MAFVIGASCVDIMDKSCIEECPVDCIYEGGRMLYIHPTECIDCAACEPVCPVEAIVSAQHVTDEWRPFQDSARAQFEKVGSPGGSSNVDILTDTDFVAGFQKDDD